MLFPLAFALISAVLAALDVAYVDVGSHGLGESSADVGGSCRGRRVNSSNGVGKNDLSRWMFGIAELMLKPNRSGFLGGFFGGWAPLGPNPSSQFPFLLFHGIST